MAWRVGRKLGRTVYDGDQLIGVMDTPELAETVVAAINQVGALPQAGGALQAKPARGMSTHQRRVLAFIVAGWWSSSFLLFCAEFVPSALLCLGVGVICAGVLAFQAWRARR
jgi:hypothetical protein